MRIPHLFFFLVLKNKLFLALLYVLKSEFSLSYVLAHILFLPVKTLDSDGVSWYVVAQMVGSYYEPSERGVEIVQDSLGLIYLY